MDRKEKKPVSKGVAWLMVIGGTAALLAAAFALSRWTGIGRMGRSARLVFAGSILVGDAVKFGALRLRSKTAGRVIKGIGWAMWGVGWVVVLTYLMTREI